MGRSPVVDDDVLPPVRRPRCRLPARRSGRSHLVAGCSRHSVRRSLRALAGPSRPGARSDSTTCWCYRCSNTPSGAWRWDRFVVVHPAGNADFAEACARYRELLADESTFSPVTVEELLAVGVHPVPGTCTFTLEPGSEGGATPEGRPASTVSPRVIPPRSRRWSRCWCCRCPSRRTWCPAHPATLDRRCGWTRLGPCSHR